MASATIGPRHHAPCPRAHRPALARAGAGAAGDRRAPPCRPRHPRPDGALVPDSRGPDLRPVGVDHLGPRDPPPRPRRRSRARRGSRCRCCSRRRSPCSAAWRPTCGSFVARAGALAGVYFAFRLGRRLGGLRRRRRRRGAATRSRRGRAQRGDGQLRGPARRARASPPSTATSTAARAPRSLLALGAALLRPEVWPFVGLYGAVAAVRASRACRKLVVAGFVALPVLWLAPEWWGSGDPLRAAHRAQNPRAEQPGLRRRPGPRGARAVRSSMLTPAFWAGLAALAVAVLVRRPSRRELASSSGSRCAALVWVGEVAVMTSDGFSGNIRYLIMPAAALWVVAGVGVGWLDPGTARRRCGARRPARRRRSRSSPRSSSPCRPGRRCPSTASRSSTRRASIDAVGPLVARAGGRDAPARVRRALHRAVPGARSSPGTWRPHRAA